MPVPPLLYPPYCLPDFRPKEMSMFFLSYMEDLTRIFS
jgi:hypothetical protein